LLSATAVARGSTVARVVSRACAWHAACFAGRMAFVRTLLVALVLCVPALAHAAPEATLHFGSGWTTVQDGAIVQGGTLVVAYDLDRLTTCRGTHNGYPAWDTFAFARFEPGGQTVQASVREFETVFGVPTNVVHPLPAHFQVPADATSVQVWFESVGIGCWAWDSNQDQNYRFDVAAPPAWLGAAQARLSRDSSDACDGGVALDAQATVRFDTWTRQRAAVTNVCFRGWSPGVTDRDLPSIWRLLDARVHWRLEGGSWQEAPVAYDRRVGNDARWAWSLRNVDPFRAYHCPEVPATVDAAGDAHIRAELYFSVNGVELRPGDPASTFALEFVDHARDPFRDASCAP
jgi:hypothetical protein